MNNLREEIIKANINEHEKEAKYYDVIHTEIYNYYEQKRIDASLYSLIKTLDKNTRILEVGCGTGNLTIKLLNHGFDNITCLDLSLAMIKELKRKIPCNGNNIEILVTDLDNYLQNNNDRYSVVVMSSVLHHLPDYIHSLNLLEAHLDDDGFIFITHEPTMPPSTNIMVKILLKLDFVLYSIRYITLVAFGRLKFLNRDCSLSDYHTGENAINLDEIMTIFSDYEVDIKKYPSAKMGIIAELLNFLGYANNFELVLYNKKIPSHKPSRQFPENDDTYSSDLDEE